ncbi:hypothetical protein ACQ1ZM_16525, partial [Enterococcus faecalis]|uniref:hypothetical protein n=1 Tax=Enterococcus faecalis TaxID=1351 RepID=UPI003D6B19D9
YLHYYTTTHKIFRCNPIFQQQTHLNQFRTQRLKRDQLYQWNTYVYQAIPQQTTEQQLLSVHLVVLLN